MYVLHMNTLVTMGYYIDSLDVCFGTQLVDSRADIGVIYAYGLMHIFILLSLVEIFEQSLSSLCWIEYCESGVI